MSKMMVISSLKKKKKKHDNFQVLNLKCNKRARETTKGKTVMDYHE